MNVLILNVLNCIKRVQNNIIDMKTINLDILVSDHTGGYRFSKDFYIHPGKGGEIDEEMIR